MYALGNCVNAPSCKFRSGEVKFFTLFCYCSIIYNRGFPFYSWNYPCFPGSSPQNGFQIWIQLVGIQVGQIKKGLWNGNLLLFHRKFLQAIPSRVHSRLTIIMNNTLIPPYEIIPIFMSDTWTVYIIIITHNNSQSQTCVR